MKAGKNDSPVAIFTIDHNCACLNSALVRCLLDAAFRAIDHVPCFLLDRLLSFLRAFQQLNPKQYLTPCLFPGPAEAQFPDMD